MTHYYTITQDENGEQALNTKLTGTELLNNPVLNKGSAFNEQERVELKLTGLLPPYVSTLEQQIERCYENYSAIAVPLQKYQYLRSIQDRNETLYYALLGKYTEEMTPIIYTPTVGEACQKYSHIFSKPRGLYITKNNIHQMEEMMESLPSQNIKIIVVTDSQGILGIGDQGVGGMGIPIGKLSLYTLGAGIHPHQCLPITLDIGTDRKDLLDDPLYLGIREKRMIGDEYDKLISNFVDKVKRICPSAVLQWEDFSKGNAFENLNKYIDVHPSFNDDIQGTGSVALSAIINATRVKKEKLADQTYAIYGAGAGGVGIAHQIHAALIHEGLDSQKAYSQIYILDSKGVVTTDRKGLDEYKKDFAKDSAIFKGQTSLDKLLINQKITVLIGTSGQPSSFTKEMTESMMKHSDRPIIFPLSNPTSKTEALPKDLLAWSQGKALIATGSPFDNVEYNGKSYRITQANNALIFPGVGLGAIASDIKRISNKTFTIAAYALADATTEADIKENALLPRVQKLQKVSIDVAIKIVVELSQSKNKSEATNKVKNCMWEPRYLPYKKS